MRYAHRPLPPRLVAFLLVVVFAAGCADPVVEPRETTIVVQPEVQHLTAIGQSTRVTAMVLDQNDHAMTDVSISWNSSAPDVLEVDETGQVTARGVGNAAVRAEVSGVEGQAPMFVSQEIASVATSLPELHFMAPGDTFRIGALARDAMDTTMPEIPVTWSTSDPTVVEVDGSGGVRAVGPGEAVVRATAGSGVTGNVPVRVDDRPGISCSDDPVTIERIDDEPFHWYFDTKILLQPDPTGLVAYAIGSDPGLIRSALAETGLTALEIEHDRWVQLPETTTLAEARAAVEALRQDPRLTFVSLLYRRSNGDRDRLVNRLVVQFDEGATQEDIVCLNRSVGLTLESEKSRDGYLWLTLPLGLEPLSVANYYHLSSLTEWADMDRIGEGSPQDLSPPARAARTRSR